MTVLSFSAKRVGSTLEPPSLWGLGTNTDFPLRVVDLLRTLKVSWTVSDGPILNLPDWSGMNPVEGKS